MTCRVIALMIVSGLVFVRLVADLTSLEESQFLAETVLQPSDELFRPEWAMIRHAEDGLCCPPIGPTGPDPLDVFRAQITSNLVHEVIRESRKTEILSYSGWRSLPLDGSLQPNGFRRVRTQYGVLDPTRILEEQLLSDLLDCNTGPRIMLTERAEPRRDPTLKELIMHLRNRIRRLQNSFRPVSPYTLKPLKDELERLEGLRDRIMAP